MFIDTDFLRSDEIFLKLEKTVEGNADKDWLPAYHFDICDKCGTKMGECDLRIGHNEKVYYGGNIGYGIDKEYRGHHFAGKACMLLFELARKHHMEYLIITCNPNNYASRKTCEYAGGILEEVVQLPDQNDMRLNGETEKCIYRFDLHNRLN
ncbi:GNAT family N-acetyltransferase [Lacrimispora sp. BS-2]|uniref:GNAT family N-acetyltransferase n=1 Tax=Lacrimispora sp. BS-2 TaxID=3151850 RepID=A0AAU7PLL5_9FIRM